MDINIFFTTVHSEQFGAKAEIATHISYTLLFLFFIKSPSNSSSIYQSYYKKFKNI